jgi:hypothetical protein
MINGSELVFAQKETQDVLIYAQDCIGFKGVRGSYGLLE